MNIVYYCLYMGSKKYNKPVNITKKGDSQIERTNQWLLQCGEGQYRGAGMEGTDIGCKIDSVMSSTE